MSWAVIRIFSVAPHKQPTIYAHGKRIGVLVDAKVIFKIIVQSFPFPKERPAKLSPNDARIFRVFAFVANASEKKHAKMDIVLQDEAIHLLIVRLSEELQLLFGGLKVVHFAWMPLGACNPALILEIIVKRRMDDSDLL